MRKHLYSRVPWELVRHVVGRTEVELRMECRGYQSRPHSGLILILGCSGLRLPTYKSLTRHLHFLIICNCQACDLHWVAICCQIADVSV